ncbi:hypothetical protein [Aureimonas psammosilenae]|uniref:hypothetical protein n=1 Tax=Aureimonas psammosilenae TaxID=2495496 RepID=UPI00186A4D19|nr:hypothetical protein [Aureimonas psammosilenae]
MCIKIGRRFELEWTGNLYVKAPWFGGKVWEAFWDRSEEHPVSTLDRPYLPA